MDGFDIIADNLALVRSEREHDKRKLAALISELAREAVIFSEPRSAMAFSAQVGDLFMQNEIFGTLGAEERALLSEKLVYRLGEYLGRAVTASDLFPSIGQGQRIAYVKSRYTDIVYEQFSRNFDYPTVKYASDTESLFRMLESGDCEYIIVQTGIAGKPPIPSILDMMSAAQAYTVSARELEQSDGDALQLALMAMSPVTLKGASSSVFTALELSDSRLLSMAVADTLALGFTVSEMYSRRTDYSHHFYLELAGERSKIPELIMYINAFLDGTPFLGMWENDDK